MKSIANHKKILTEYHSLDIMRLIMSIVVVSAHTRPFDNFQNLWIQNIYTMVVATAVPFFFLCTGFFLNKKMIWGEDTLKDCTLIGQQAFRYGKLYLIFSVIYLPLAIVGYLKQNITGGDMVPLYIRDFFLAGEHYNSYQLWFLLSAVYALLIAFLLRKFNCTRLGMVIVGLLFLMISYSNDFEEVTIFHSISSVTNKLHLNSRIFIGLFYIAMGMFLEDKCIDIRMAIPITVVGLFGCLLFRKIGNQFYIFFQIILNMFIFITVSKIKLPSSPRYNLMRDMSKFVYFYHMWIWTILYAFVFRGRTSGLLIFICTSFVSIVLSWIIVYIKNRRMRQKLK